MGAGYNGRGVITLKKEKEELFSETFDKIYQKLRPQHWMTTNDGSYQFDLYWKAFIVDVCEELLNEIVDVIESAQIEFVCPDEDGTVKEPFPQTIKFEVADGQVFRETMNTRLSFFWWYNNADDRWFQKLEEKNQKDFYDMIHPVKTIEFFTDLSNREQTCDHDLDNMYVDYVTTVKAIESPDVNLVKTTQLSLLRNAWDYIDKGYKVKLHIRSDVFEVKEHMDGTDKDIKRGIDLSRFLLGGGFGEIC